MIKERFIDIVKKKPEHQEKKSGDEIVAELIKRAGLELS